MLNYLKPAPVHFFQFRLPFTISNCHRTDFNIVLLLRPYFKGILIKQIFFCLRLPLDYHIMCVHRSSRAANLSPESYV